MLKRRRFNLWLHDHLAAITDLAVIAVLAFTFLGAIYLLQLQDRLSALARAHPDWQLPSLLLWLAMLSPLLIIYAVRRWREATLLLADADTDSLTRLHNRRKAERLLDLEFDRALRYERPLSLITFDIDRFKRINDSHGHPVGDLVLQGVARRVKRQLRATDSLARWGGEEFLLICPETDATGALLLAERMRRAIRKRPMGKAGTITASFGVSTYGGEGKVELLIARADQYLYAAKQTGRDRVVSARNFAADMAVPAQAPALASIALAQAAAPLTGLLSSLASPLRKARQPKA